MKKFEIEVKTKQGNVKTVKINVDDTTVELLSHCNEEEQRFYLEMEYRMRLNDKKQQRWNISLDKITENGHEFVSLAPTPIEQCIQNEGLEYIEKQMKRLTDKQYRVFVLHAVEGKSLTEIAKIMCIKVPTVHRMYWTAVKILKEFLKKG